MSIGKQQSSIVKKMAGKQCRLLLFFVVPIWFLTVAAMLYGFLGSYREEAETMIVQLENGKIALGTLDENSRVNYRITNKKEKIELKAEIPYFVFAPVKMGETAGEICVIIKNNVVAQLPLVYAEDAVMAYPCLRSAIMEVSL